MSNIERKYAYYDEGVLPEEGEYGVTYLTLYSSSAGNIYDGWIYDPDNKIPVSVTERTFGYRHPEFSQYCWDDEVVVDLSNAQSRQESSEFAQGRLWSFNTNVSPYPIVLEDIDITGLTEEEREAKATTVLFSAIPLVDDSYIQAQIEVQCKCNLSPDNTSGEMRIEAFFIINDESDRSMRPDPVHTFTVSSANERHTLPWVYANPALKHDVSNYIGVKLICTGGTAEIGISDAREYGNAMITLVSAGLTGDKIEGGKPAYLEIFGLDEVVAGYELDINDYTVLCEYNTGEIYDVTHMCEFTPAMGTEIVDAVTTLTARYAGLEASMQIQLGMVERIELDGLDTFHGSQVLDIRDYTVIAYFDNGDLMDVTDMCTFSPAMGTKITSDTTLVATYAPSWMQGQTFSDSLEIEKIGEVVITVGDESEPGLVYTLYDDNYVKITGNALVPADLSVGNPYTIYEHIEMPYEIQETIHNNDIRYYDLEWAAEGPVSGIVLPCMYTTGSGMSSEHWGFTSRMIGFDGLEIRPRYISVEEGYVLRSNYNPIMLRFIFNETLTSEKLSFLKNIEFTEIEGLPPAAPTVSSASDYPSLDGFCQGLNQLKDLNFLSNIDVSLVERFDQAFAEDSELEDVSGITDWRLSSAKNTSQMFIKDIKLKNAGDLYKWKLPYVSDARYMYAYSGLETCVGLGNMDIGSKVYVHQGGVKLDYMFASTKIKKLNGLRRLVHNKVTSINYICLACDQLEDIKDASHWDTSNLIQARSAFAGCNISDISPLANLDVSSVVDFRSFLSGNPITNDGYINGWNVTNVDHYQGMFSLGYDDVPSDWRSSIIWSEHGQNMTFDKLFVKDQTLNKIAMTLIESFTDEHPNTQIWRSNSGMYSGRDAIIVRYTERHDQVLGWSLLHILPSWYTRIYSTALNEFFNIT